MRTALGAEHSPSEARHIRFAQPRALGRKVSDEYTVPVCRLHHRDLHSYGDEASWWAAVSIDPLPVALELWRRSRVSLNPHDSGIPRVSEVFAPSRARAEGARTKEPSISTGLHAVRFRLGPQRQFAESGSAELLIICGAGGACRQPPLADTSRAASTEVAAATPGGAPPRPNQALCTAAFFFAGLVAIIRSTNWSGTTHGHMAQRPAILGLKPP